jgi:sec-independent protein translocase protein TatA
MPSIGPLELAVILVVALVVFGPKRLPELGKSMGRGIREFRGSLSLDDQDEIPAGDGLPRTAVDLTDESSDSRRGSGKSHPRDDDKGERRREHSAPTPPPDPRTLA